MSGGGKYEAECALARNLTGGSVILIVFDGERGNGISCAFMQDLADDVDVFVVARLREIADAIEEMRRTNGKA